MAVSAKRNARIELSASSAGMDRGLADARRKMKQFERDTVRQEREAARAEKNQRKQRQKDIRGAASGALGMIKNGAMMSLGIDAAGGIQGMAGDVLDYEKQLTRLQITAEKSPAVMRAFSDSVMRASNATGVSRNDILGAASAYVALTGDMKTAQESTGTWAKVAQATNTPMADIASTAAAMTQQLGITSGEMEAVFSGLSQQGKAGAVELKDLAGLMAQIAPQWGMFQNGKGARGVAELGAALQVVKRGFGGDAAETVTGLQSLLTAVTKNAGKFAKGGVNVFNVGKDGKKTMKDVFSIIDAIGKSKLVNDPEAMEKAFGRVEAYRAYLQLAQNKKMLQELTAVASDAGAIQRDFGTYMNSPSGKMEQAWTRIKNEVAAALTPERISAFANALVKAADAFIAIMEKAEEIWDRLHGDDSKIVEKRSTEIANKWIADSKNLNPHEKEVRSRGMFEAYSKSVQEPIKSGSEGTIQESYREANRKAAYALRAQALVEGDPWRSTGQAGPVGSTLEDPTARKVENEVMMRQLKEGMVEAIARGFAQAKSVVNMDGNAVANGVANATVHRRGH